MILCFYAPKAASNVVESPGLADFSSWELKQAMLIPRQ
jgi:hypothetical protein